MTRFWKEFTDSPRHLEGPPPSVQERAEDERYANAVNALAAVFRFDIEDAVKRFPGRSPEQFARLLSHTGRIVADGLSTDSLYARDVFDQYGPGAVLLALKRAYELPQPSAPLVGD